MESIMKAGTKTKKIRIITLKSDRNHEQSNPKKAEEASEISKVEIGEEGRKAEKRKAETQNPVNSSEESHYKKAKDTSERSIEYSPKVFNLIKVYLNGYATYDEIEKTLDDKGYHKRAGLLLFKDDEKKLSLLHRAISLPFIIYKNDKLKAKKLSLELISLIIHFAKTLPRDDFQSLLKARDSNGSTVLAAALKTGEIEVVNKVFAAVRDGLKKDNESYQELLTAIGDFKANLFHDAAHWFSNNEGLKVVAQEFDTAFGRVSASIIYELIEKGRNKGGFLPHNQSKNARTKNEINDFIDGLRIKCEKGEVISAVQSHSSGPSSISYSASTYPQNLSASYGGSYYQSSYITQNNSMSSVYMPPASNGANVDHQSGYLRAGMFKDTYGQGSFQERER